VTGYLPALDLYQRGVGRLDGVQHGLANVILVISYLGRYPIQAAKNVLSNYEIPNPTTFLLT
jgi:hypothetical protein